MSDLSRRYELRLDLPAAHTGVSVARRVLRDFARMEGLASQEIEYLMLVVSELLANAIDHGGGEKAMTEAELTSEARMRLSVELEGTQRRGTWTVRVSDQGGGDPAKIAALIDPRATPDLEDERGRGLFLLAKMVDRMAVEATGDGRGLTIIATKHYGER